MIDVSIAARHYVGNEDSYKQLFERRGTLEMIQRQWNAESFDFNYSVSLTCQFHPNYWTPALQRKYAKEAKAFEKGGVRPYFLLNDGSLGGGTTYRDRMFNDNDSQIRVQLDVDAVDFEDVHTRMVIEYAAAKMLGSDIPFGVLMKGNIKRLHGDNYLNFKRLALEALFNRHAKGKMPYAETENNPFNLKFENVSNYFVDNGDHTPGLNIANALSTHFETVKSVVNKIVDQNPGFLIEYYNSIYVDSIYGGPKKAGFVLPIRDDDFDSSRSREAVDKYLAYTVKTMLETDLKDMLVEDILSGNALRDLNAADLSCKGELSELKNMAVADFMDLVTPVALAFK